MTTFIIEPHGDDALISCYPLLKSGSDIRILTLGSSRSSHRLMEHFPSIVGTEYADLYEISIHIARASYKNEFLKWSRNGASETPWYWQLRVTKAHAGELWKESSAMLCEYLESYIRDNVKIGDLIISPIGIVHPYHVLVSSAMYHVSQNYTIANYGWYSDAPYNDASWVRAIEDSHPGLFLTNKNVQEFPADDTGHKEKVFRDVYPAEVKLFRFSYAETIQNVHRAYLP